LSQRRHCSTKLIQVQIDEHFLLSSLAIDQFKALKKPLEAIEECVLEFNAEKLQS